MYVRILSTALFLALSSFLYPTNSASAQDVDAYERYAARILKAYDKDSDGFLDGNEMKAMRRPPEKQADTDGDGKISKLELSASVENLMKQRAARALPATDRVRKKSLAHERYAAGLLKSYDKDADGFLNSSEMKVMRRPPKKEADTDGDGKISKLELIASFKVPKREEKANSAEAIELENQILQRIMENKEERRRKDLERQILEKIQDGQAELPDPAKAKRDELEQLILQKIEERMKERQRIEEKMRERQKKNKQLPNGYAIAQ